MKKMTDFINLVQQMRTSQKEYFRTRSAEALETSKALEKGVDRWLKEKDQLDIFG
ncbi:MAG: hypothetical protein KAS70_05515 [Planctomycetes bacterium]|nr:hypothetical protein [Planctomycetota bacterium]